MRLSSCDPEHPLLWPVRPIARTLCDALGLVKHCRFCAINMFLLSGILLFLSYEVSHEFGDVIRYAVHNVLEDAIPRQILTLITSWLTQIIISNTYFFIFRYIISRLLYALYELGNALVYSLLRLIVIGTTGAVTTLYFLKGGAVEEFIRSQKLLTASVLISWSIMAWYWARYVHRKGVNRKIFDHDVGAALTEFQRR